MKHICLLILLLSLLCGCSSAGETALATETSPALWTEENLLEVFQQNARAGAQVLDCVIMEQSACNMAGVVQYTMGDESVCRFDFIKEDGSVCRMGMEFLTDGEKTLRFAAQDSVSCRMLREDGAAYTGTIIYYEDVKTGEKGFKVSESE